MESRSKSIDGWIGSDDDGAVVEVEGVFTYVQAMPRLVQRWHSCWPSHFTLAARQLWQAVIGRRTTPRDPELFQLRMKMRGISPLREPRALPWLGDIIHGLSSLVLLDGITSIAKSN
jgi:hypothetical protein